MTEESRVTLDAASSGDRRTPFGDFPTGVLAPPGSLDAATTETLREYKLRVAKRYRAVVPAQIGVAILEGRLFISPKIDGELWFAVKRAGRVALCAPNGRVLQGAPVVRDVAAALAGAADETVVAGELFARADEGGGRPRVFHVGRALRGIQRLGEPPCAAQEGEADRLGFKAFDLVSASGEDAQSWSYERRLELLRMWFPAGGRASIVATEEGDKGLVGARYAEWVESGRYEGLVARHEGGAIFKVKPIVSLDAVIVAWSERLVYDKVELRELQVALIRDDGRFHVLGSVSGFDEATRATLHARLDALGASSTYRMANREGTLCRFVRPELVIEIDTTDVMAPEPGESQSQKMTLAYSEDGGWEPRGLLPMCSLIHPRFLRIRQDKRVDAADVGLEQLRQIAPFDEEELAAPVRVSAVETSSPSRVLERKVWVKSGKGGTAVRKFVAWATGRADKDPRYPAFVVAFTDFSPGRKEPLQRELRVASSEPRIRALAAAWEAENIKKGWTPA